MTPPPEQRPDVSRPRRDLLLRLLSWRAVMLGNIAAEVDDHGIAQIHLFGDARVRVLAEQQLVNAEGWIDSSGYSEMIELDPRHLPAQLDLTISPKRLFPPRPQ